MAESVKRINVTLPVADVERIKQRVSAEQAEFPSVSAFVAAAVAEKLAEAEAEQLLHQALIDYAGEPTEEDRAWAAEAMRTAHQVAGEPGPTSPDGSGTTKRDVA